MHYLHAILIAVQYDEEELKNFHALDKETQKEIIEDVRSEAKYAIENFGDGTVFDWCEDDAGRWADEFPYRGVVLGAENPELFIQLLDEYHQKPLEAAKEALKRANEYYSPNGEFAVNESLLEEVWNNPYTHAYMYAFKIRQALELALGRYTSESHFYCPDKSSTRLSLSIIEEIKANPHQYALVFLDLHN